MCQRFQLLAARAFLKDHPKSKGIQNGTHGKPTQRTQHGSPMKNTNCRGTCRHQLNIYNCRVGGKGASQEKRKDFCHQHNDFYVFWKGFLPSKMWLRGVNHSTTTKILVLTPNILAPLQATSKALVGCIYLLGVMLSTQVQAKHVGFKCVLLFKCNCTLDLSFHPSATKHILTTVPVQINRCQ